MRVPFTVVALVIALTGCDSWDSDIQAAEHKVRETQKDPDSVEFRNVEKCPKSSSYVTGEVNGKNSYGAYVGFSRFYANQFVAHVDSGTQLVVGDRDFEREAAAEEDHRYRVECFEGKESTGSPPRLGQPVEGQ